MVLTSLDSKRAKGEGRGVTLRMGIAPRTFQSFGTIKSLSIAKNHPKPSQEFSERFGPFIHKMKGFSGNSPQKFTRTSPKTWEDDFLGIPFLASKNGLAIFRPFLLRKSLLKPSQSPLKISETSEKTSEAVPLYAVPPPSRTQILINIVVSESLNRVDTSSKSQQKARQFSWELGP